MIRQRQRTEVIKPPRHIRDRVGSSGGVDVDDAIARANAAVSEIADTSFLTDITPELENLEKAFAAAAAAPAEIAKHRTAMFNASHEIRGQSGTFGYPLATIFADSLCKLLDHEEITARDLDLLGLHVQALTTIFKQKLKHDGGAVGAELKRLLAKAGAESGPGKKS